MKNKTKLYKRSLQLMLIVLLAGIASCQSNSKSNQESASADTLIIEHKLGKTSISSNPSKTVTLDIGALETMNELGVKPIGIPKKFLPAYLSTLKSDDQIADVGSVIEPDFEAISALNPDLILISTRQERFYNELSEIAPTIFIGTDNKNYIPSLEKNIQTIGRIFSKEKEAQEKLGSIKSKMQEAQSKYDQDPNKALFLIYNNGKFSAFGKGSRFGFIHDVMHIKPVMDLKDESVHGQRVSNELIAQANPDYLFIVDRNAAVMGKVANREDMEKRIN